MLMCKIFWFFASFLYIRKHFKALVLRSAICRNIQLKLVYLKDNFSILKILRSLCF